MAPHPGGERLGSVFGTTCQCQSLPRALGVSVPRGSLRAWAALRCRADHLVPRFIHRMENRSRTPIKEAPRFRDLQAAPAAQKQLVADFLFQFAQALAKRWLGHVQDARGTTDLALLDNRAEIKQSLEIHRHIHTKKVISKTKTVFFTRFQAGYHSVPIPNKSYAAISTCRCIAFGRNSTRLK